MIFKVIAKLFEVHRERLRDIVLFLVNAPVTLTLHSSGRKMSKTLGNVVDPMDLLEQYPADTVRSALVSRVTLGEDVPFSEEVLLQLHNSHLANTIGNCLSRCVSLCRKYCDGAVPDVDALEVFDLEAVRASTADAYRCPPLGQGPGLSSRNRTSVGFCQGRPLGMALGRPLVGPSLTGSHPSASNDARDDILPAPGQSRMVLDPSPTAVGGYMMAVGGNRQVFASNRHPSPLNSIRRFPVPSSKAPPRSRPQ